MQLRISERLGMGVNKIVSVYGKKAFLIEQDFIKVTIPYLRLIAHKSSISEQKSDKKVSKSEKNIQRILAEMRNNPNITSSQLAGILGISTTAVEKNISYLKDNGYIEKIGSNKSGHWKV